MSDMFKPVNTNLPAKRGAWLNFKSAFLIELTPHEQKIEDEINAFLYQEVTWQKIHDFLFQEITFGKKKKASGIDIIKEEI